MALHGRKVFNGDETSAIHGETSSNEYEINNDIQCPKAVTWRLAESRKFEADVCAFQDVVDITE